MNGGVKGRLYAIDAGRTEHGAAYEALAARLVQVTAERDRARTWAVELEQRLAAVQSAEVAAAFEATLYPEETP